MKTMFFIFSQYSLKEPIELDVTSEIFYVTHKFDPSQDH